MRRRQKSICIFDSLTRSFDSCFKLRYALPFLAKLGWTISWSLYPHELSQIQIKNINLVIFLKVVKLTKSMLF